jgi:hypothetical protein
LVADPTADAFILIKGIIGSMYCRSWCVSFASVAFFCILNCQLCCAEPTIRNGLMGTETFSHANYVCDWSLKITCANS